MAETSKKGDLTRLDSFTKRLLWVLAAYTVNEVRALCLRLGRLQPSLVLRQQLPGTSAAALTCCTLTTGSSDMKLLMQKSIEHRAVRGRPFGEDRHQSRESFPRSPALVG